MSSAPQSGWPPPGITGDQALAASQSFGADAERYDRARPRYPDVMIEHIVEASPGPDVLDVGIGTGIVARQFASHGCRVVGVDPDDGMAALARRTGFEVDIARFEDWDPAGRHFDTVVSGQTWHWMDPVLGAARAADALRTDGRLAVFWNAFEPPAEIARILVEAYRRMVPDPGFARAMAPGLEAYSTLCHRAAEGMREVGAFGEPEQWRFDWEHSYTRDGWLDQVPTLGGINQLPPGPLEELLAALGAAIDADGGSFMMAYATQVVTAARSGPGEEPVTGL